MEALLCAIFLIDTTPYDARLRLPTIPTMSPFDTFNSLAFFAEIVTIESVFASTVAFHKFENNGKKLEFNKKTHKIALQCSTKCVTTQWREGASQQIPFTHLFLYNNCIQ